MEGGYGADEDIDECDDDNHDHGDATGSFYILSDSENQIDGAWKLCQEKCFWWTRDCEAEEECYL